MDKKIIVSGKKIFYRVYGKGKPVMLVHGFGETGDVWMNQIEFLKKKFFLIVPDLPGSGQSEMVGDMSMEGMAEVLKTISGQESLNEITVIGHSMGGYITLAFVDKYPDLTASFGLFHSTAFPDSEEKKAIRRKGIEFIKEHSAYEFLKTTSPNLFSVKTKEERPELVSQFIQGLKNFGPDVLIAYYESMIQRPDRTDVLKNFNNPVLFVMGEQDNAIPLQDSLMQCHLSQKVFLHIMHQSGHMGMLEEADKSNRLLQEFLDNI
jgi:pimeloyl-ACP methyl ester carboxylesterase